MFIGMLVYNLYMSHIKKPKEVRKVIKNGRNSYYINIPKEIVDALHIKERQKLTVELKGKSIVVKDWKK